jgi:hypothetical protein
MSDFTDEEIHPKKGEPLFLGVIGTRQDLSQDKLIEDILIPMLQEFTRPPDKVILPSEGYSSIYISDWADSLKIPTQTYEANWHLHNRRAKIFRDARIQQESTHFLIFLNKRSDYNSKLALRLAKQGRTVLTVDWNTLELELLIPSSEQPSVPPTKRESKRDTGKGTSQKQEQPLLCHRNHTLLPYLLET